MPAGLTCSLHQSELQTIAMSPAPTFSPVSSILHHDSPRAAVFFTLCPAERGRFAGSSPVALSERSEFSGRSGGPSAARAARRAGARRCAALRAASAKVGAGNAATDSKVPPIPHPLPNPPLEGEGSGWQEWEVPFDFPEDADPRAAQGLCYKPIAYNRALLLRRIA